MLDIEEIEAAYNDLLNYEADVKNFLLYVCGFHNANEMKSYAKKSKKLLNVLKDKKQKNKCYRLISLITKAEENLSIKNKRLSFLRGEFLRIERNTREWINSAVILMKFYNIILT